MTAPCAEFYGLWITLQRSRHAGLEYPEPVTEHAFHPTRAWRYDFAWPDAMTALEVEGGVFVGGGHTRGVHYSGDCEKYNAGLVLGWHIFRITPLMLRVHPVKYSKTGKQVAGSGTNPIDMMETIARFIRTRIRIDNAAPGSVDSHPPRIASSDVIRSAVPRPAPGVPPFSLR